MNAVKLEPSKLKGNITIPPSKSISHRAVICAALAEGCSTIENIILSEDIKVTLDGMKSMGATVQVCADETNAGTHTLRIQGSPQQQTSARTIDCGESGSTLRFLIPLACRTGEEMTFTGKGKLVERPLNVYYDIFDEQGINYSHDHGRLPLTVQGILKPGNYKLKGNISSQFITGLMFVLPVLAGDSTLEITTELESQGYVDLTIQTLRQFGIAIDHSDYRKFMIQGNQHYQCADYRVEGDYSQAAFWLAAGSLGADMACHDLNPHSLQGDRVIVDILRRMNTDLRHEQNSVQALPSATTGTTIDVAQCPDLVPILAVVGCLSRGTTRIVNAARLRIKESDRLKAITTELNKLGAHIREGEDSLTIEGVPSLTGGQVESWNDHRIAMALAIASTRCREPVMINGCDAVSKSYPHFWEDFTRLGGTIQ